MAHTPKFYENYNDEKCTQCTIKGIVEFFEPQENWTEERIDQLTAYETNKGTWAFPAIVELIERGYHVIHIDKADSFRFAHEGMDYIRELYGEQLATQMERSNYKSAISAAKKLELFPQNYQLQQRHAELTDFQALLAQGFLLQCNLNSRALNAREGYSGHSTLIYKDTGSHFFLHDPGLPAQKSRRVSYTQLMQAGLAPNGINILEIIAYKKI